MQPSSNRRNSVRTPAIVLLACGLGSLATAQEGVPEADQIPIPSDQEGRDVLELTLFDALRLGRVNNVTIAAESLTPLQQLEQVRIQEAFFEPEFFGNIDYSDSQAPPRNVFSPEIRSRAARAEFGLRQRLATGGLYELSFAPTRLQQTAAIQGFPDVLYQAEVAARITQPLLRGAWSAFALNDVRTAEAALGGSRSRFERSVQDTLIEIVQSYWELAFAREDYRVVYQALDLAREQLRITNERIRVRTLAERDRVFDEAEVARRREQLIRAENEIRRREDTLRALLFDDADGQLWLRNLQPISPIGGEFRAPELDWREVSRAALQLRPDLTGLRAEVEQAQLAYDRAWRDVLPQLDLVGGYAADAARTDGLDDAIGDITALEFPDWNIGVQFVVPIGNNAARGARDRALLALEQTRRRLYAAEIDVTREVREALRDLRTLAESIRAAQESVRLAETQLDTERERLKVGRGTIFEVQQRNQELLDARQQLLRNQLDYRISESRLLYVQGVLEAPGIGGTGGDRTLGPDPADVPAGSGPRKP